MTEVSAPQMDFNFSTQNRLHRSNDHAKRCGRGQGEGALCSEVAGNDFDAVAIAALKRLSLPVLCLLSYRSKKVRLHAVVQTDSTSAVE